ncbi:GH39 family glycosyl hydrolase [Formosa sp. PL04]|uniref:GH39 family glycosyl hydrolase n=1 Tax=Formosa sp. PL04 TaxID=3081755 RepID=UPI0029811246|nr:hypothetical protein [Formosa sp. PL04]MDW5288136.1 hypothetical protein [Formosa sp. PL04]
MKKIIIAVLFSVSQLFVFGQKPEDNMISEMHTITVDADNPLGEVYNLWDVRVINAPELWGKPGFAEKIKATTKHINYINSIRALGGKHNGECEWFKGVDDKGEPICDFEPFIAYIKAQRSVGFTPWIVLDNVPNKMSNNYKHQYGNTSPPDDYDVWFKYIQQFVSALVDEFGMDEVSTWRFRVGTEPDLFPGHWSGTKEQFFKHYDYTVAAVESIIENPWIGPGNMLMWNGTQEGQKGGRWGFEILKHCAEGTNYYTEETGTRIDYFSQSVYAWSPKPFLYEENMKKVRAEIAKYPSLKNIELEIHEYGELNECLSRGDALSNTEFFVGLYAHTIDVAYKYNVRRIYNWDQHLGMITTYDQIVEGLFQPWVNIMDCLSLMENGERVAVLKDAQKQIKFGTIAAWKDGNLYALVYSHHDDANQETENTMELTFVGDRIGSSKTWSIKEQLLDKDHGVYIHQLYKDIEAAGIAPKDTKFYLQRNIARRYGDENQETTTAIIEKNLQKYQDIGKMKVVKSEEFIKTVNNKLEMKVDIHGSGFHFIKLTPVAD